MSEPTQAADPRSTAARFCSECGAAARGKFCAACGTALAPHDLPGGAVTEPDIEHATMPLRVPVPTQVDARQHDQRAGHEDPYSDADHSASEQMLEQDEEGDGRLGRRGSGFLDRRSSGRTAMLAVAAVLAAALLGTGGVALMGYLGNGPERDALSLSRTHMTSALSALAAADDPDAIAAAARTANTAAERIGIAVRSLGRPDDETSRAVQAQLNAEVTLLSALGQLADLPDQPLAVWGTAHRPISEAIEAENGTRAALRAQDRGAVDELPDTGAMLRAVTGTVGALLAADAVRESGSLLTGLRDAATTSELRAVAAKAAEQQPAVASVLDSLTDDTGRQPLVAYDRALRAVAGLAELDGERTGAWAGARGELTAAFGALAGAVGVDGAGLTAQATSAIEAADRMISAASAAIADWQAAAAAAIKDRDADSAALTNYADSVRAELKSYELLRTDLQTFFDRAQDPNVYVTYYEAYEVLAQAEQDRKRVRDGIAGLAVPSDVRAEHDAVVAMINRSVSAVRAAYDGSAQADMCVEYCYYRDTPGFARFQAESAGISESYGKVTGAWESAVAAAKATTAQRPLPPKPEV